MNKRANLLTVALSVFLAVSLAACTVPPGGTASVGTVQMWVTDAPRTDNVSEIWVTVSQVKIHKAGGGLSENTSSNTVQNATGNVTDNVTGNSSEGQEDNTPENISDWITVNITGANRFDLLTLKGDGNGGGIQQILASANLAPGRYTQIRMAIDKVEVKLNGELKEAAIPGGKLKFVHPFEVQSGNLTRLLFDFDADKFVTVTGNPANPKILVKPVVKLIVSAPQPRNDAKPDDGQGNRNGNQAGAPAVKTNVQGGPQTKIDAAAEAGNQTNKGKAVEHKP